MKNYAFISYNHKDVVWAKWLFRKLENYRLPVEIHNEFSNSRYLRPIFRDRDELNCGILDEELSKHLEASKYLIVICSKNSAESQWVNDEVEYFISKGRVEYIIPFIVDSKASMDECLPPAIREWNNSFPKKALLSVSVLDEGTFDRQKALIRIISRMLDVNFDVLWKRHQRRVRKFCLISSLSGFVAVFAMYWLCVPVSLSVNICRLKSNLPDLNTMVFQINGSEYTLDKDSECFTTSALPGYMRGRRITLIFNADRYYLTDTTTVQLGWRRCQNMQYEAVRDSSFALFYGCVFECDTHSDQIRTLDGVKITIDTLSTWSDCEGRFLIAFPLEQQSETKPIILEKEGYVTITRPDECPGGSRYIMKKARK